MRSKKYSSKEVNKIDLGTKIIYKYPTPTKLFDIARMVVKGRHPRDINKFILEHKCNFVIYVTKGFGKVFAGEEVFNVKMDDVVFVPIDNKFAVKGNLEYVTVDTPAFYPEQSEEVTEK